VTLTGDGRTALAVAREARRAVVETATGDWTPENVRSSRGCSRASWAATAEALKPPR
jgi:hypothetical protein